MILFYRFEITMVKFKLMKQLPELLAEIAVHVNNMVYVILIPLTKNVIFLFTKVMPVCNLLFLSALTF